MRHSARVEVADRVEPVQRDRNRGLVEDGRAARETAAPADGHHRHVVRVAPRHDRRDLLRIARPHERPRGPTGDRHVADDGARDDMLATDDPLELPHLAHARWLTARTGRPRGRAALAWLADACRGAQ